MIDFSSPPAQSFLAKLESEQVIWLTTVSSKGVPQPRLVWFIWDGEAVILYSEADAWKLRHIAANPNVALHFNSDFEGSDFQVMTGLARIDPAAPPVIAEPRYLDKYREWIYGIDMTEESYSAGFFVAVRVTPTRIRGLAPL